jgi:hypothetical protein
MSHLVILPGEDTTFVELARTARGRVFRKKILPMDSEFSYPTAVGGKVRVDAAMAESLVRNFKNRVCDIVQVPVVDDKNRHSEDPLRNIGEVIDVDYTSDGVYATIDARNKTAADAIGSTLLGVSAMLSMDYVDTKTGEKVGPTLLHTAITNRPYLSDLGDFEEVVRLSADSGGEVPVVLSRTTTETLEVDMTKEEMIARLKDEFDIDVEALLAAAKKAEEDDEDLSLSSAEVGAALIDLGVLELSAPDASVSLEEIGTAVVTLSDRLSEATEENVVLSGKVAELEKAGIEREVDTLIAAGKIFPANRDAMVELAGTNRSLFDSLIPEGAIVSLSEVGVTTHDAPESQAQETINRLAEKATTL